MIPVPTFYSWVFILLNLAPVFLLVLVVWLVCLIFSTQARSSFKRNVKKQSALLLFLILPALFWGFINFTFARSQERSRLEDAAKKFTLTQSATAHDLVLPAGTQIVSQEPGNIELFKEAVFPHPSRAFGLLATRLVTGVNYSSKGQQFYIDATLSGDQIVQGWHCSAAVPIRFAFVVPLQSLQFQGCQLSTDHVNPGFMTHFFDGAQVFRSTDYGDCVGAVWTVEFGWSAQRVFRRHGVALIAKDSCVDGPELVPEIKSAWLAKETEFGPITHKGGTELKIKGDRLFFKP
jgi:hypothetical protein